MIPWTICAECGRKENSFLKCFNYKWDTDFKEHFCSEECNVKFREKKKVEQEMERKGMIKEIKCKCNQCGKTWHYLESREKEIKESIGTNAKVQMGFAFFNVSAATQAKRNVEAQKELLDQLKRCPKCGSHDITKEDIYFKNKK